MIKEGQDERGRRERKRHVERKTGIDTERERKRGGRRNTKEKRRIKGEKDQVMKEKGKDKDRTHLFDVDEERGD